MALIEGCRHELEILVPAADVEAETTKVVAAIQKKAKLPGFRPGKAPLSLIKRNFAGDIRQQVLENLVPDHLQKRVDQEGLKVISTPDVKDLHFHDGQDLHFKAEFEVSPEFELGEYQGLTVPYTEPVVTEEDVAKRIEELRDQSAQFVNVDPRPVESGDYAVLSLKGDLGGGQEPIDQDEVVLQIGGQETLAPFTENLMARSPGDELNFDVSYPEDYGQQRLAGKTVHFHAVLKGLRRKELPEVTDEFAQDLGDYRTVEELREAVRRALYANREQQSRDQAKNKLVDQLVASHEFPVPEAYIDRQIRSRLESQLRDLAEKGIDVNKLPLDWKKIREAQKDTATHDVKASLLLGKVADREAIVATHDEVDREVERIARAQRQPVAAIRMRLEQDGVLSQIASRIQTDKTLTFLFERATKVAEA